MRVSIPVWRWRGCIHSGGVEKKEKKKKERNKPALAACKSFAGLRQSVSTSGARVRGGRDAAAKKSKKVLLGNRGSVVSHDLGSHNIHSARAVSHGRLCLCCSATLQESSSSLPLHQVGEDPPDPAESDQNPRQGTNSRPGVQVLGLKS